MSMTRLMPSQGQPSPTYFLNHSPVGFGNEPTLAFGQRCGHGGSYFLWLSVKVMPCAETLK